MAGRRPSSPFPRGAGRRLAAVRRALDVSQYDLAPALGVSQKAISAYERDAVRPSVELAGRLRGLLDSLFVSYDWVLTGQPPVWAARALAAVGEAHRAGWRHLTAPSTARLLDLLEALPARLVTEFFETLLRVFPGAGIRTAPRFRALIARPPSPEPLDLWYAQALVALGQRERAELERDPEEWTPFPAARAVLALRRAALLLFESEIRSSLPVFREAVEDVVARAASVAKARPDAQPDASLLDSASHVLAFCEAHGVSPAWLLAGEGPPSLWAWLAGVDPPGDPYRTTNVYFSGGGPVACHALRVATAAVAGRLARALLAYDVTDPAQGAQAEALLAETERRFLSTWQTTEERRRQEAEVFFGGPVLRSMDFAGYPWLRLQVGQWLDARLAETTDDRARRQLHALRALVGRVGFGQPLALGSAPQSPTCAS